MKDVATHEPGRPEVLRLEETETPEPGAVPIRVEVAGIDHADAAARQGMTSGSHRGPFRVTPGFEVVGTVASRGGGLNR